MKISNFSKILFSTLILSATATAAVVPQTGENPIVIDNLATTDNITYLMGAAGARPDTTSVQSFGQPKHAWLKSIDSSEYVEWTVQNNVSEDYHVTTLLNSSSNQSFNLEVVGHGTLTFTKTEGGWERLEAGVISIPAGIQTLRLTRTTNNGDINLKSLELIKNADRSAYLTRVNSFKSDASNFSDYKYGLMFQSGAWGYPQTGAPKSINGQADDFNVSNFVNMVKSTGAEYVIWSATWWTYELNAPITAVDNILGHSNRTSTRDLIGDIANALDAENIGFFLYYHSGQDSHLGYGSTDWWQQQSWPSEFVGTGTGDRTRFFNNWISVMSDIGNRYGNKLDGWFFDDGLVYYPAPFESLGAAAKAGNPDRLIAYNPWIVAHYTDFEDLSFGEECKAEGGPVGGTGLLTSTGDKGTYGHCMPRMENDWGIRYANQPIGSPNYSVTSAYNTVMDHTSRKIPTSFNLMMYENGAVSQSSLDVLTGLKEMLSNSNGGSLINNDNVNITYSGGTWNTANNRGAGDYNDDVAYTGNNGAYVEYTFNGVGVKLIGPKDPSQGLVEIFVDGVSKGVVDTYSPSYVAQADIFEASSLSSGTHTIKMVKVDKTWMQIDAISVTKEAVVLNNTGNGIAYNGNWYTSSGRGAGDYQDDVAYTTTNEDYVEYTFTGTGIEIISEKYSDQGNVEIQVDSEAPVTVDTTNSTRLVQQVIYSNMNLASGTHTIKMTKKSGQYMLLDSIKIYE